MIRTLPLDSTKLAAILFFSLLPACGQAEPVGGTPDDPAEPVQVAQAQPGSPAGGGSAGGSKASVGEPGRGSGKPNPLKNLYFGEQHMHTRNSFDAFTIGVNMTWEDAYNYAKGKEIKLSTTGERMQKRTPYDFVAITDHAEYYGVLKEFANPDSPLADSDFARGIVAGQTDPEAGTRLPTSGRIKSIRMWARSLIAADAPIHET